MKNRIADSIKQLGHVIDLWMPIKIKYDKTPGVSIAIAHKGEVIYSNGFGFANLTQKKANGKTRYHIASHSKMFTATAIMKLVEEGKVRLDDHVVNYIPWFNAKTKHSDAANITIRQLLSHTAGVFRDGDTPHWITGNFPKDLEKSFSAKSLTIENLTTFKYTNYGYSLLGLVIECASGISYEEYITKQILKPLNLRNTQVDYKKGLKNIATGYSADVPDEKRIAFPHYAANAYAPATGFISDAFDLVKFISAFSLNSKSNAILNRESIKEMTRPHAKTEGNEEYGLGLDILYSGGKKLIGHGGGYNGYSTRTLFDTANDIAVIVLSNSLRSSVTSIATGIMDSIHRCAQDFSKNNKKAAYTKYEGLYRNVWGDVLVSALGNTLIANDGPETNNPLESPMKLIPTSSPNTFIMKTKQIFNSYDEEAVFSDFKNGKSQKMLMASTPLRRVA